MEVVNSPNGENAPSGDTVVSQFVGVLQHLRTLIEEENAFLERGLPATLLDTTDRKGNLSRQYDLLGGQVVDRAADEVRADPTLQKQLLKATAELVALTEDNRELLDKALVASRRRIAAVMDAIRDSEATTPSAESPKG